ncbi:esterase [Ideonella azotifigens]|uniref:Esterase n=2 Tax=Ideonella azotifigens TaxID=513160 RepID=A0ABP3V5H2_9BURK|nr:esterase [Ideonella azotifigens]MCD2341272.1 esterase [Ideonella azotifigens]
MNKVMTWLPAEGRPEQLMLLLHGVGSNAAGMAPLARLVQKEFPQAAIVAPEGFSPFDGDPTGQARQWFSVQGVTEENRVTRVAEVLPALADWVHAMQQETGLGPAATALWGFSQGSIMALSLVQAHDGIAGRVLAFAGRYPALPDVAPQHTTLHFFHGSADTVIPEVHARAAIERLGELHGDATIDIAEGVGHEINGHLLQCAILRLRSHIPHRSWAAAMGAVPGLAGRLPAEDEED